MKKLLSLKKLNYCRNCKKSVANSPKWYCETCRPIVAEEVIRRNTRRQAERKKLINNKKNMNNQDFVSSIQINILDDAPPPPELEDEKLRQEYQDDMVADALEVEDN